MSITDQMGHQVAIPRPPQRIISLVPSQTELLFDLGLDERIVGITKFCIHPREQVKGKTIVGGTKNFHMNVIRDLQPDLIIGNKEENYQEGIRELQQHYPVWMSDMANLEEALAMMAEIGRITAASRRATALIQIIRREFRILAPADPIPAAYFIWKEPYMTVGQGTFIQDMLGKAGFANVFQSLSRYPEVSKEDIRQAKPSVILLSSEPYPFREKHLQEFRELCPKALVKLIDGEMFSWYGSRLRLAPAYFGQLRQETAAARDLFPGCC
jgi:ABC-type Fe3+-hydroxamate transport system substrate-binding protein